MIPHINKFLISLVTIFIAVSKIKSAAVSNEPYQLSELLNSQFVEHNWNGTWITDECFYYKSGAENTSLVLFNAKNRSKSVLIEYENLAISDISSISPSPDLQYLLIKYEAQSLRYITTAKYKVLKLDNNEIYDVGESNILQSVKWSLEGHSLVYAFEFNLYYLANLEDAPNPRKLTSDGVSGEIHNGLCNEIGLLLQPSEEEEPFLFSLDGRYLAFLKYNLSEVGTSNYFVYGKPGSLDNQYPKLEEMKYSKAGTALPKNSVFTVDLGDPDSIPKEYQIPFEDGLIDDLAWTTNNEFSYIVTNRAENNLSVIRCPLQDVCYQESAYFEPNGWLLETKELLYSRDGNTSVDIQAAPEGDDFYFHLILTDLQNKNSTRLTFGKRRVLRILFWDKYDNLIYYQSTLEDYPSREHAYVINTVTLEDTCLTCNFSTPSGSCLRGTISPSTNATYFAKICNGPSPSYVEITDRMELLPPIIWVDNGELVLKLSNKLQPIEKDLLVPIADGYNARVRIYFPPEYNDTSLTKYPTLVYVYAGPDEDQISDEWYIDLREYWVTNKKYIYVMIDGRGCGRDGRNKMFEIYRRLGTVEIEDQINVTRYLQENIPAIDAKKTGIWGWSYGGFAAASVIAKDTTGIFKFGISVAPVTNFIYYQSVSYERFFGLPTKDDNLEGYENCDIAAKVEDFRGKSFFLIHGNADFNVHYQHSMILARALQKHDVPFQLMSYPDEDHSLDGVKAHLYLTIDQYIENQFK